jgi:predicted metal-dependent hydrolase
MTEPPPAWSYSIRVSKRAKKVTLTVSPGQGLEIVVPCGFDRKHIPEILLQKKEWIERAFKQIGGNVHAGRSALTLPQSIYLRAVDRQLAVKYVTWNAGILNLTEPDASHIKIFGETANFEGCLSLLHDWMRIQGQIHLMPWLERMSAQLRLPFKRAQIRGQKSRWGSCSSKGTISLNYKLLFLPPELVRYLLIHELCHTRHMDHSPAFWSFVANQEPNYKALDAEINTARKYVPPWADM